MWVQVCAGVCMPQLGCGTAFLMSVLSFHLVWGWIDVLCWIFQALWPLSLLPHLPFCQEDSGYRPRFLHSAFFIWVLGIWTQVLMSHSQHFIHWVMSLAPPCFVVLETKLICNVAETVLSVVGALSNHLLKHCMISSDVKVLNRFRPIKWYKWIFKNRLLQSGQLWHTHCGVTRPPRNSHLEW